MSSLKKLFKSARARTTLALVVIGIGVVLAFYAPKEKDPNIGLVNDPVTPTVGITNLVDTLTLNQGVDFSNVHLTITTVQEASAFSDDTKRAGAYTVRVNMHAQPDASIQQPVHIDFASLMTLLLPGGKMLRPKLISLLPVILPGQASDGFFDFPVTAQTPLAPLSLQISGASAIPFGG